MIVNNNWEQFEHILGGYDIYEDQTTTAASQNDINNGFKDEFGVVYSADGKRLLKAPESITNYTIRFGTEVISDNSFKSCRGLIIITIPGTVTHIGNSAFCYCASLQNITLPQEVSYIGDYAFAWSGLRFIALPNSLKRIGSNPFMGCSKLEDMMCLSSHFILSEQALYSRDKTRLISYFGKGQSFTVPYPVLDIGRAFYFCKLDSITLPESLIFIDYNPFKGCCNLDRVTCVSPKYMVFHHAFYSGDRSILISYFGRDRDLTIPPGVTHIESSAFSQNKYIQTVSLPQGITHIGNSAFSYCQSLRTIHLPQGLTHIDDLCFNECSSLQSIEIPSSLTHLGIGAFNNCKALPIVSLPQSLIKIGRATFQNCTSLKEVSLNQKLRQISINMFRGCESLKAITLPNNVTEIGDFAFCKCKSLQTISLPNSITKFGVGVFDECGSLSRIGVPYCSKEKFVKILKNSKLNELIKEEGLTYMQINQSEFEKCKEATRVTQDEINDGMEDEYGAIYSQDGTRLLKGPKYKTDYMINPGTRIIADSCFLHSSQVRRLTIPNSVTHIGDYAFIGNRQLEFMSLPMSLIYIGDGAFFRCSLSSIVLPINLKYLGGNPFSGTQGLRISSQSSYLFISNQAIYSRDKTALFCYWGEEQSFSVPEGVKYIGHHAFALSSKLHSIILPQSLEHIGGNPFICGNLEKITCLSSCFLISDCTLYSHDKKNLIRYYGKETMISVPDGVTTIEDDAFAHCGSLQSVSLPSSLAFIGNNAFTATSLRSISLPIGVTHVGKRAFAGCREIESISLPQSTTHIGEEAFSYCSSLKTISIPKGVTHIGERAFCSCKSLLSFSWPQGADHIGYRTFAGCKSLQSISIPEGVTRIGEEVFDGCESLQSITIPQSVNNISKRAFSGCGSLRSISIPEGVKISNGPKHKEDYHKGATECTVREWHIKNK